MILCIQIMVSQHDIGMDCSIRTSTDQSLFDSSPRLFAVYYVLHRLFESRHPPHASVTFSFLLHLVRKVPTNRNLADNRLTTENFRSQLFRFSSDNICLTSPTQVPPPLFHAPSGPRVLFVGMYAIVNVRLRGNGNQEHDCRTLHFPTKTLENKNVPLQDSKYYDRETKRSCQVK